MPLPCSFPRPPLAPTRTHRPLSGEDRTLLWRFRFALTTDKRALTKFLKCVDWSDASEARQVGAAVCREQCGVVMREPLWSGLSSCLSPGPHFQPTVTLCTGCASTARHF